MAHCGYNAWNENSRKLLILFRTKTEGLIDCAYILKGGLNGRDLVINYLGPDMKELFYNPHISDDSRRITKGKTNPNNTLLLVDNSYKKGISFREAVNFFRDRGYPIERPYGFYFLGNIGIHGGAGKPYVPILDTAQNFLGTSTA